MTPPYERETCPVCDGTGELGNPCPFPSGIELECNGCNIDCETYTCHLCEGQGWLDQSEVREYYKELAL